MYNDVVQFIKSIYPDKKNIPLHAPVFIGREKDIYLIVLIQLLFHLRANTSISSRSQ